MHLLIKIRIAVLAVIRDLIRLNIRLFKYRADLRLADR